MKHLKNIPPNNLTQDIARLKIELASQVPSEPELNNPKTVSLLFKLPNGQRIERRFEDTHLLKVRFFV